MELDLNGRRFIARHEGYVGAAYRDGTYKEGHPLAGQTKYSIGFGHHDDNIKPGDTITFKDAFALLKKDAKDRSKIISNWIKVPLQPHEFAALVSLYYQSGKKFLINEGVIELINAGHVDEALDMFPTFDTDDEGKHVKGLRDRRIIEQHLFKTGDYGELSPIPYWPVYPGPMQQYEVQPGDFE